MTRAGGKRIAFVIAILAAVAAAKRATLKLAAFGIGTVEVRLAYAVGPTRAARMLTDEPTAPLDSERALKVVRILHQPATGAT